MSEEKRMVIAKIVKSTTRTGKPVVEMYTNNARLEFPELRLFELSELTVVGIDPNDLVDGEERYVRFWAFYTESSKHNRNGNPYRDVTRLEPMQILSTTASAGDSAILDELRQIHETLAQIQRTLELAFFNGTTGDTIPASAPAPEQPASAPGDNGDGHAPAPAPSPLSDDEARRQFSDLAGPAVREQKIDSTRVRELAKMGSVKGWGDALRELKRLLQAA